MKYLKLGHNIIQIASCLNAILLGIVKTIKLLFRFEDFNLSGRYRTCGVFDALVDFPMFVNCVVEFTTDDGGLLWRPCKVDDVC